MTARSMEWKIRECSRGGVVASFGCQHSGGVETGCKPGVTLPAFIEYLSVRFDTKKQAERYIANNPDPLRRR